MTTYVDNVIWYREVVNVECHGECGSNWSDPCTYSPVNINQTTNLYVYYLCFILLDHNLVALINASSQMLGYFSKIKHWNENAMAINNILIRIWSPKPELYNCNK